MNTQEEQPISAELLDSEEYVHTLIHEQDKWFATYGKQLPQIKDAINRYLDTNTPESLELLFEYIKEHSISIHYKSIPEIACIIIMCTIYQSEREQSIQNHIFTNITSIDVAVHRFQALKFLLIDIEWDFGREQAVQNIVQQVSNSQLSVTALTYMIQSTSINKSSVCDELISGFMFADMRTEAVQLTYNKKAISHQ